MEKSLITEHELREKIQSALKNVWTHPEHVWEVESLKAVNEPSRNWEAETSFGGNDLLHVDDCEECMTLHTRVLDELASKYDVSWPS